MTDPGPVRIHRALLSVWMKDGLMELGAALAAAGVELVASGGTAAALAAAGVPVTSVEVVTGAPEILGGRVKTLHPVIHAGILARRDREADRVELAALGIAPIDLVVVTLYPFAEAEAADAEARTELIDIGGVTLIRAAAKNWRDVTVVTDPSEYGPLLAELAGGGGAVTSATRRRLAARALRLTAWYDSRIAGWLSRGEADWPERWTIGAELIAPLRYGENPHQRAALYRDRPPRPDDLTAAAILQGKELSYNNYVDLEAARRVVRDLHARAAGAAQCAIVKHTIPCGAASAEDGRAAWARALAADPVSAFGGVVAFSAPVDAELATDLADQFLEVIYAPAFAPEALRVLAKKKALRLLAGPLPVAEPDAWEIRRVGGGLLVQTPNLDGMAGGGEAPPTVATAAQPSPAQWADLDFAWTVCRSVASNAIVLARDQATLGVGGGQTNRVGAVELAIRSARSLGHDPAGAVLASDGFFPFADGVEAAAAAGIVAIIQPGGSRRDEEVIAAADRAGIAMVLTGRRQFRH